MLVDRSDDIRVARPQHDPGAGAGGDRGQRGAPGAAADDRQPPHASLAPAVAAPSLAKLAALSSGQRGRTGGVEPVDQTEAEPLQPGPGDHRAIVGAQRHRRRDKGKAGRLPPAPQGDRAAADWRRPRRRRRGSCLRDSGGETRRARSRCDRPACRRSPARWPRPDRRFARGPSGPASAIDLAHRRLQPGEREIAALAPFERPRQREPAGIAIARRVLDRRPAGIAEPQQLGGLVEGFAGGIVAAGAELAIAADPGADQQLGVAAGNQQQQIGKPDIVREPGGERMRFEMVDREERLLRGPGDALCRHRSDDQPADQPGTGGRRHAIELFDARLGFGERAPDQPCDMVEMRPRGDLRHDAAIGRMLGQLGVDQIGPDQRARAVADHRDRSLVAARLDAENSQAACMQGRWRVRLKGTSTSPHQR